MRLFASTRKVLLIVALLTWPALVHANIGDNLSQLRARYGSASAMGPQLLFEVRFADEKIVPARDSGDDQDNAHDRFSITVYFDGAHSAMEIFTHNTSDPKKSELTQSEIDAILAAESDGQSWSPIQVRSGKPTWMRSDQKLIARFSPNTTGQSDGASVLVIMVNSK